MNEQLVNTEKVLVKIKKDLNKLKQTESNQSFASLEDTYNNIRLSGWNQAIDEALKTVINTINNLVYGEKYD